MPEEARNELGETALITAAKNGEVGKVKQLLDASADMEATDKWGRTALMWCAREGWIESLRLLVRLPPTHHAAAPSATAARTPLHPATLLPPVPHYRQPRWSCRLRWRGARRSTRSTSTGPPLSDGRRRPRTTRAHSISSPAAPRTWRGRRLAAVCSPHPVPAPLTRTRRFACGPTHQSTRDPPRPLSARRNRRADAHD